MEDPFLGYLAFEKSREESFGEAELNIAQTMTALGLLDCEDLISRQSSPPAMFLDSLNVGMPTAMDSEGFSLYGQLADEQQTPTKSLCKQK